MQARTRASSPIETMTTMSRLAEMSVSRCQRAPLP